MRVSIRLLLRRLSNWLQQEHVSSLQDPSHHTRSQGHQGSFQSRQRMRDKDRNSVCNTRDCMITAPRKHSVDTGSSFPPPRSFLNSHFTSNYILPYSQPSFCVPAWVRGSRLAAEERVPAALRWRWDASQPRRVPSEPLRCQGRGREVSRLPPCLKVNEGAAPNGGGGGS